MARLATPDVDVACAPTACACERQSSSSASLPGELIHQGPLLPYSPHSHESTCSCAEEKEIEARATMETFFAVLFPSHPAGLIDDDDDGGGGGEDEGGGERRTTNISSR